MIVFEEETKYLLFSQDDHAHISGSIAEHWRTDLFPGAENKQEVLLAIREHDRGWLSLDSSPSWNHEKGRPHDFLDYPVAHKISAYSHGITEVLEMSSYAGLLCSLHYTSFMEGQEEAAVFLKSEQERQHGLMDDLGINSDSEKKQALKFHFDLLQLCDNLSLYLCLNPPGISKEREHRFFKNGFPQVFPSFSRKKIFPEWPEPENVSLDPYPFNHSFQVKLPYKELLKGILKEAGLEAALHTAENKIRTVNIVKKGSGNLLV